MKIYIFLFALISQASYTKAQAQDQDITIIHAGDNFSDYFTYRFPSFADATILFKNGTSSTAKMNFNTFLCKMQFIEPKGDTLVVSNPGEIDSIRLNDRSFFYNKDYFEIIAALDSVKLVVLRKINIDEVVTGALGIQSHTANVKSYDSYVTPMGPNKLLVKEDLSIRKQTVYSLIDKNGAFINASRSGFLKIFPGDKKSIEGFLKSNKINFNSQADLEKLFLFCTQFKT
jgi:hypothetical protein